MKPFNLEAALQGEPVQLRNGCKAIVYYKIPKEFTYDSDTSTPYPLRGLTFNIKGNLSDSSCYWCEDGKCHPNSENPKDIIGMWEEPTPTVTLTLPKPFKPKKGEQYFTIVAKSIYQSLSVGDTCNFGTPTDNDLINQGNAFKKEEDAQAWIDAMRDAVYE